MLDAIKVSTMASLIYSLDPNPIEIKSSKMAFLKHTLVGLEKCAFRKIEIQPSLPFMNETVSDTHRGLCIVFDTIAKVYLLVKYSWRGNLICSFCSSKTKVL